MMPMKHATARSRPGRFVVAFSALVLLAGAALWWQTRSPDDRPPSVPNAIDAPSRQSSERVDPPRAAENAASTAHATDPTTTSANWPASLRDSEPDGAVTLDASGRVVASLELRRLFDYFLSALGERDVAAIRALLLAHVRALHGDVVAADVAALFDRYVDYQQALASMNVPPGDDLRERLARVRELRRRLLDTAMAEAFFGDEERYTEYTLDRRDVMANDALDERARRQRLDELDARLSPEQRAGMQEANTALLVDEQNRQFDALRLDPTQRQSEREALFGAEAAQRLAQADAEQAAWDARVRAYVQARDALRADVRLDGAGRDRAITQLRERSFDAAEQRRVASLEAIGQL
jgi:lipase chaperone LimK